MSSSTSFRSSGCLSMARCSDAATDVLESIYDGGAIHDFVVLLLFGPRAALRVACVHIRMFGRGFSSTPACAQFKPWQKKPRLRWHCVVQARWFVWQQVLLDGGIPTARRVLGSSARMLLGEFSLHLVCTIGYVYCLGSRRFSL